MSIAGRHGAVMLAIAVVAAASCREATPADERIVFERVPDAGFQPQAIAGSDGNVHIIYFRGEPQAGDLFYTRRSPDGRYSPPLQVNSQPRSAIASGTVRGGQLALGRDGRIHVVWNGSAEATPKAPGGLPLFYARLSGGAFEPQRGLLTWSGFVDGGSTIAADGRGKVFVAWHANPGAGADTRAAVFLAVSDDDGATFAREERVSDESLGACGCCSMRALIDSRSALHVIYRTATRGVDRDSTLLTSRNGGLTFDTTRLHPWSIAACPMSTYALADGPAGPAAAWETDGRIYMQRLGGTPVAAGGPGHRHPVLAFNAEGDSLLAWLEGAHNRGGAVGWQVYDRDGRPTTSRGTAAGVPQWGLAAAASLLDGRFLLLY